MVIKAARSKKDIEEFIRVPWRIYSGDPMWVPPLLMMMRDKLDRQKHPFFRHAEAEFFTAFDGRGEALGRIAAIVDHHHNEAHADRTGFFGLFESPDDPAAAQALFDAAGGWLKGRGMDGMRGPVSLSMNDECGLLIEGFDSRPVFMMPYNPRYYPALIEGRGFAKAKDLLAFYLHRTHPPHPKIPGIADRLRKSGEFAFRHPSRKDIRREAQGIRDVYNNGWRNNWGFVPWTEDEMAHMVEGLIGMADLRLVLFAEKNGEPVGFACGLPDFNQIMAGMNGRLFPFGLFKFLAGRRKVNGVRAIVFGVKPEYMRTGLAYLLYDEFAKAVVKAGHDWCELSWELEDNEPIMKFAVSLGAEVYKKYRIYEKSI